MKRRLFRDFVVKRTSWMHQLCMVVGKNYILVNGHPSFSLNINGWDINYAPDEWTEKRFWCQATVSRRQKLSIYDIGARNFYIAFSDDGTNLWFWTSSSLGSLFKIVWINKHVPTLSSSFSDEPIRKVHVWLISILDDGMIDTFSQQTKVAAFRQLVTSMKW